VREGYLTLAKENPSRYVVVDGSGTIDEVFERTMNVVRPRL
jgi:dTMP kinase